ncbi:hypothetical protein DERP_009442 [Dermatophagoides pteronyssinus]|uniref:Uncharacterized protein n=1 Tax=Dermatophagoides pteronyssinus TaxID=6956 RepID=A0ABQ8IU60_DERPT|nr:hypothetical protein DERP_009442 [Dermatophagoides pteronyssinus]
MKIIKSISGLISQMKNTYLAPTKIFKRFASNNIERGSNVFKSIKKKQLVLILLKKNLLLSKQRSTG